MKRLLAAILLSVGLSTMQIHAQSEPSTSPQTSSSDSEYPFPSLDRKPLPDEFWDLIPAANRARAIALWNQWIDEDGQIIQTFTHGAMAYAAAGAARPLLAKIQGLEAMHESLSASWAAEQAAAPLRHVAIGIVGALAGMTACNLIPDILGNVCG